MRFFYAFSCLIAFATLPAQQPRRLQHLVVTVAASNDEWTTTGVTVQTGDILVANASGKVIVGSFIGGTDANGMGSGEGALEFKIGVTAGRAAGAHFFHNVTTPGELKFRVRDSRYQDNSGNFEVDLLIIPSEAIPSPSVVGEAGQPSPQDARGMITAMKSDLRNLVAAEEAFFSDSAHYTNRLDVLGFVASKGVVFQSVKVFPGAWTATVTHSGLPGTQCGIAVNAKNPTVSSAGEGEPACR